mgnify:FL=1|tara:strand:+ start:932 stop:1330 length:399 start_codon:yes stop_codon:yes gene_type:complete
MQSKITDFLVGTGFFASLATIAVAALPLYDKHQERVEIAAQTSENLHLKEYESYLASQSERCKHALSYYLDENPNTDITTDQRAALTNALKKSLENCYAPPQNDWQIEHQSAPPKAIGGGGNSGGGGASGNL